MTTPSATCPPSWAILNITVKRFVKNDDGGYALFATRELADAALELVKSYDRHRHEFEVWPWLFPAAGTPATAGGDACANHFSDGSKIFPNRDCCSPSHAAPDGDVRDDSFARLSSRYHEAPADPFWDALCGDVLDEWKRSIIDRNALRRQHAQDAAELLKTQGWLKQAEADQAESDRDLCQLQDALGCPCEAPDCQQKAMERLRDLIAAEGELGDAKVKAKADAEEIAKLRENLKVAKKFAAGWSRIKDFIIAESPQELFRWNDALKQNAKADGKSAPAVEVVISYLSSLWREKAAALKREEEGK